MSSSNRRVLFAWILFVGWLSLILVASGDGLSFGRSSRILRPLLTWLFPAMPEETMWRFILGARKAAHVSEYCVLALLARRGWRLTAEAQGKILPALRLAGLAFGLTVACAALDEYRQTFTSSRQGSVGDVCIDASGAALGLFCMHRFVRWRERRRPGSTGMSAT